MKSETLLSLVNKKLFLDRVSEAIVGQPHVPVTNVELQVWSDDPKKEFYDEFIIVTYSGGAIAVRIATGNSNTANFQELANMIRGGYYDEVKGYREMVADERYKRIL